MFLYNQLTRRQEEICKLREELRALEINTQCQIKEKLTIVEKLNDELDVKNSRISKHLEQIDQCTLESLTYKAKCDEQEKELERFRIQLNEKDLNTSTRLNSITEQLTNKEEFLNKIYNEVIIFDQQHISNIKM